MTQRICSADCENVATRKGMCEPHYRQWRRTGEVRPLRIWGTLEERLAAKYVVGDGGCWLWTGRLDRDGYGHLGDHLAHRQMMASLGHDLTDLEVDHLCRVRRCVNPEHLEVVTREENIRRMYASRAE